MSLITIEFPDLIQGLIDAFSSLGEWLSQAYNWIGSGINWIAQQIYNFGEWIYNGIIWVIAQISSILETIWNAIAEWFAGIGEQISSWVTGFRDTVNQWFTDLMKNIRNKIIMTVTADIAIAGAWKAGERILQAKSGKDIFYGIAGMILSPVVGYFIGQIVDTLVPKPSTEPYPLVPKLTGLQYTPPAISIPLVEEKQPPSLEQPPRPPHWHMGVVEETAEIEAEVEAIKGKIVECEAQILSECYIVKGKVAERGADITAEYLIVKGKTAECEASITTEYEAWSSAYIKREVEITSETEHSTPNIQTLRMRVYPST